MLYPFIYTGTRYYDFRVVTSKSLAGLPHSVVQLYTDVARAMIDAENNQLEEPSWALVKKNGYTLWGLAILNKVLGEKSQDETNRPVRGFFGFISDNQISRLPYSISYFKEFYNTYVMPIWDSLEQTEQINCQLPPISGDDFITKSLRLNNDINVELEICRVFPYEADCKDLIEACFASFEDCSIATNVHKKSCCIEFGKEKLSFMNVIGALDSSIRNKEDIKVYVKKEEPIVIEKEPFEKDSDKKDDNLSAECGNPVLRDEVLYLECKDKKQYKKYLKYGLYGFITLICLVFVMKGPTIWEKILTPKHTQETVLLNDTDENHRHQFHETRSLLNTNKSEMIIQDVTDVDVFQVKYESSSIIKTVKTSEKWIHIITPTQQYNKYGIIEFKCELLIAQDMREGIISIVNEEGDEKTIKIKQMTTNSHGTGFNDGEYDTKGKPTPIQPVQKVVPGESTSSSSSSNTKETKNPDVETSTEGNN